MKDLGKCLALKEVGTLSCKGQNGGEEGWGIRRGFLEEVPLRAEGACRLIPSAWDQAGATNSP